MNFFSLIFGGFQSFETNVQWGPQSKMHSVSGAGAGQGQGGGPGKYGSQASVDGSGASRAPKKRGHGMLGGDNK